MRRTLRRAEEPTPLPAIDDTPVDPEVPLDEDAVDSGDSEEPWVNPAVLAAMNGEQVVFGGEIVTDEPAEPEAEPTD